MSIDHLKRTWNHLGRRDAFWAVLTGPAGAARSWNADEFFLTGRDDVQFVLDRLRDLGHVPAKGRALDFGCGVGRLTQALAPNFDETIGVDVSDAMIEQANSLNRYPDRCRYVLNQREDLGIFGDAEFDFIYSRITLQHIPQPLSTNYIRDFLRLLRRGGVAVFQIPAADIVPGEAFVPASESASTTLPPTAYAASIEPERRYFSAAPGARVPLHVKVTNRGAATWPAAGDDESGFHSVRVANRWRNRRGRLLRSDESRAVLPDDLPPGEHCTVELVLFVPETTGWYLAEIDMVHEGVTWFAEHSSRRARALVRVTDSLADGCFSRVPLRMQMYGIARDAVVTLVESSGGRLLDVTSDDAAGAEWKSHTYYVEKL